jgi:hypothetical protein
MEEWFDASRQPPSGIAHGLEVEGERLTRGRGEGSEYHLRPWINGWNRLAISFRSVPRAYQPGKHGAETSK